MAKVLSNEEFLKMIAEEIGTRHVKPPESPKEIHIKAIKGFVVTLKEHGNQKGTPTGRVIISKGVLTKRSVQVEIQTEGKETVELFVLKNVFFSEKLSEKKVGPESEKETCCKDHCDGCTCQNKKVPTDHITTDTSKIPTHQLTPA